MHVSTLQSSLFVKLYLKHIAAIFLKVLVTSSTSFATVYFSLAVCFLYACLFKVRAILLVLIIMAIIMTHLQLSNVMHQSAVCTKIQGTFYTKMGLVDLILFKSIYLPKY